MISQTMRKEIKIKICVKMQNREEIFDIDRYLTNEITVIKEYDTFEEESK